VPEDSVPSALTVLLNGASKSAELQARSRLEQEVVGLFDRFRNSLFRYVLSLGVSVEDGEEVIQEVFLALFRHLCNGKPGNNLRGWIFRVAHNLALKRRNAARRNGEASDDLDVRAASRFVDPALNPEDSVALRHEQRRLLAVVRALPEQDQRCLALRAEGLRYREIAEVLGVSVGTVSNCLERALARLARAIDYQIR
jgi:RNA polymerase sigma-70 factor (ECF subfamily)